jgi:adenylate cyclase
VAELRALVRERGAGNPFFLEEIVRVLDESGVVARAAAGTALRELRAEVESGVPPTVQALLAARIDRLDESVKDALLTAAVIGKSFDEALLGLVLADLAGAAAPPALDAALDVLERASLVSRGQAAGERVFAHPLTQEVAYRAQLHERRRRVHESVARALEILHADHLGECASLIAHHWSEAGRRYEAGAWRYRAALRVRNIQLPRKRS